MTEKKCISNDKNLNFSAEAVRAAPLILFTGLDPLESGRSLPSKTPKRQLGQSLLLVTQLQDTLKATPRVNEY